MLYISTCPVRHQATVTFTANVLLLYTGKVILAKKVQPSFRGLKLMHCAGLRIFNKALITVTTRAVIMILYILLFIFCSACVHLLCTCTPSHCLRFKAIICCMRCVCARLETPSAAQIEHFSLLTSAFSLFCPFRKFFTRK